MNYTSDKHVHFKCCRGEYIPFLRWDLCLNKSLGCWVQSDCVKQFQCCVSNIVIVVQYYCVASLYWCTLQLIPAHKGAQKYPFYLLQKEFTKKLLNSFPRFDATNPEISSSSEVLIVAGWELVIAVSCWTDKKHVYLFQSYTTHVFTDFL